MSRPTNNEWLMNMAKVVATRATCARRSVGCVLTDRQGRILATGYNGPPRGFPHCTLDDPCPGAHAQSGTGLELCQAVHAEQNALLQCRDVDRIHACYVTTSPCVHCVKLLLNTPCQLVFFAEPYAHNDAARTLWLTRPTTAWSALREWVHLT